MSAPIGTEPGNGTHQFRKRTQDADDHPQRIITLTVTNTSSGDLNLGMFHFDIEPPPTPARWRR